jgi:hypothetical protein
MKDYTIWDNSSTLYVVEDIEGLISEINPVDLEEIYVSSHRNILVEEQYAKMYAEGKLKILPNGEINFEGAREALRLIGEKLKGEMGDDDYNALEKSIEEALRDFYSKE